MSLLAGAIFVSGCAHGARHDAIARPVVGTGTETRVAPAPRKIDGLTVPPVKVAIRPLEGKVLPERAADARRWRREWLPMIAPAPAPARGRHEEESIDDTVARVSRLLDSLRAARSRRRRSPPPRAVRDAWNQLLEAVDAYLDQPPVKTPAVQLVRTKVAIETELDADTKAWSVSSALQTRVRSRLAYLEHRVEQARATARVLPRGRDLERLIWPIDPVVVNSGFGPRMHPILGRVRFHYGVDLDGYEGQVIVAAGPGVVTWAGWMGGHGKHIEVMHPGGWVTRYSHLEHIMVHVGERLEAGDSIGFVGSTGRSTGPHLHFEVWHHGKALDPLVVLGPPPFSLEVPGTGWGG